MAPCLFDESNRDGAHPRGLQDMLGGLRPDGQGARRARFRKAVSAQGSTRLAGETRRTQCLLPSVMPVATAVSRVSSDRNSMTVVTVVRLQSSANVTVASASLRGCTFQRPRHLRPRFRATGLRSPPPRRPPTPPSRDAEPPTERRRSRCSPAPYPSGSCLPNIHARAAPGHPEPMKCERVRPRQVADGCEYDTTAPGPRGRSSAHRAATRRP